MKGQAGKAKADRKRRMRFQEVDTPNKEDDSLAQDIANMVEREVYDDKIANSKNRR